LLTMQEVRATLPIHTPDLDAACELFAEHGFTILRGLYTDDELDRLQDAYVDASRRVRDIGADFVDIKQCHRYLLSEMLAAKTRPGKYGGSLENRTRFVRELLARLAAEIPDLIRGSRMNFFDGVPYAKNPVTGIGEPVPGATENYLDVDEAVQALMMFRDAGLQLVNVTAGCPYFNPHVGRPADKEPPDGYGAPEHGLVGVARHFRLAEAARRACPDLPVVGTGYSYLRQYAAGCAPRDPVYARLLQEIQKKEKAASRT